MEDLAKIKQALDQLTAIPVDEWNEFSGRLSIRQFEKGAFLTREGDVENYIYFLNKGATRNYFTRDGKDFTLDFHFENNFVTAYYSLITREPSSVQIETLEPAEAVVIPYRLLQEFYKKSIHGERIGRMIAEIQYVKRVRKEMDLLSLTAEQRYAALMDKNPSLVNTISIRQLSSYLGIQPESLSRIRRLYQRN
jgi:CRP-like cAMP-binding protein